MQKEKNVILNHTLDEYKKKYRNRTYRLLKYTTKQVEDFDEKNAHFEYKGKTKQFSKKNVLLNGHKWWKIGDTYYEVPRFPRFTWFRNTPCVSQVLTWTILGAVVLGGAGYSVYHFCFKAKPPVIELKDPVEGLEYTYNYSFEGDLILKVKDTKERGIASVGPVTAGNELLIVDHDYIYSIDGNDAQVDIFASTVIAYQGQTFLVTVETN